jgi:hypothetical protein
MLNLTLNGLEPKYIRSGPFVFDMDRLKKCGIRYLSWCSIISVWGIIVFYMNFLVEWKVNLVEMKGPDRMYLGSKPFIRLSQVFSGVRVAQSLCIVFGTLFFNLSFLSSFHWPLYCVHLRFLTIPLKSSNVFILVGCN